jgi:putative nucleotidyltransferase with HDIG domain
MYTTKAIAAPPTTAAKLMSRFAKVNQELWLIFSLFLIVGLLNWLFGAGKMILGLYTLPTLFSAYTYGRRHAVLTATASILLVTTLVLTSPKFLVVAVGTPIFETWAEFATWAGILILTAYAMGTLHQRQKNQYEELRRTYFGVLTILQQFISNDKYTHNHSYRVAHYAATIAMRMGLEEACVDDIRAAALLHDIGKLETSRELLYKAASLTPPEMAEMRRHVSKGAAFLEPLGSALSRVIPIVLAHHDRYDGSGYYSARELTYRSRLASWRLPMPMTRLPVIVPTVEP